MTFGIKNVAGGCAVLEKKDLPKGFFGTAQPFFGAEWSSIKLCRSIVVRKAKEWTLDDIWTYTVGAHAGHLLEFSVALICYFLLYADGTWMEEAKTWQIRWVSRIVLFNLCCELVILNFWHYWSYVSPLYAAYKEGGMKLEPENQYEPETDRAWMFSSSTGNLEREITFTTLGWLQSSFWQCVFTHAWACGYLSCYVDFWAFPMFSLGSLFVTTYWREIHFYCAHRGMHPWFNREYGLAEGDIGAFLYRHVHSLHHKSYNPGPWSGLCMHPVEHLLYYSCATLPPLFFTLHPLQFLWCKFHADIAPVGGHDGMDAPGGKGDFHWLHHAKFECNYGVPFPINLDLLFGTWADYDVFKETGELTVSDWAKGQMHLPSEEEGSSNEPALPESKGDVNAPLLDSESIATKEKKQQDLTLEDVAQHKSLDDCWVVLYGKVFDVTNFLDKHPGGKAVLLASGGKDVTEKFENIHRSSGGFSLVAKHLPDGEVGAISNYKGPAPPSPTGKGAQPTKYPGAMFFFPVLAAAAFLVIQS